MKISVRLTALLLAAVIGFASAAEPVMATEGDVMVEESTESTPEVTLTEEETTAEEPQSEGASEEEPLTDDDLKKFADDMVSKIKELVAEGNVSRIRIRKGDTIILNLPLSVGLIGTAHGLIAGV